METGGMSLIAAFSRAVRVFGLVVIAIVFCSYKFYEIQFGDLVNCTYAEYKEYERWEKAKNDISINLRHHRMRMRGLLYAPILTLHH